MDDKLWNIDGPMAVRFYFYVLRESSCWKISIIGILPIQYTILYQFNISKKLQQEISIYTCTNTAYNKAKRRCVNILYLSGRRVSPHRFSKLFHRHLAIDFGADACGFLFYCRVFYFITNHFNTHLCRFHGCWSQCSGTRWHKIHYHRSVGKGHGKVQRNFESRLNKPASNLSSTLWSSLIDGNLFLLFNT